MSTNGNFARGTDVSVVTSIERGSYCSSVIDGGRCCSLRMTWAWAGAARATDVALAISTDRRGRLMADCTPRIAPPLASAGRRGLDSARMGRVPRAWRRFLTLVTDHAHRRLPRRIRALLRARREGARPDARRGAQPRARPRGQLRRHDRAPHERELRLALHELPHRGRREAEPRPRPGVRRASLLARRGERALGT